MVKFWVTCTCTRSRSIYSVKTKTQMGSFIFTMEIVFIIKNICIQKYIDTSMKYMYMCIFTDYMCKKGDGKMNRISNFVHFVSHHTLKYISQIWEPIFFFLSKLTLMPCCCSPTRHHWTNQSTVLTTHINCSFQS